MNTKEIEEMGMLDGYFNGVVDSVIRELGDITAPFHTVNRPRPNYATGDLLALLDQSVNTYAEATSSGWKQDWLKLAHLLKNVNPVVNFQGLDPIKILMVEKMLLKQPYKVPNYINKYPGDTGLVASLYNGIIDALGLSNGPDEAGKLYGIYSQLDVIKGLNDAEKVLSNTAQFTGLDENNNTKIQYELFSSPYSDQKQFRLLSQLDAIEKVSSEFNVNIGYGSLSGYEIGSNHNWRIQICPYQPDPSGEVNFFNRDKDLDYKGTLTPKLPSYSIPVLAYGKDPQSEPSSNYNAWNEKTSKLLSYNFNKYHFGIDCPVISYALDLGSLSSRDINLYGNSKLSIPNSLDYNPTITLGLIDDVHGSMRAWYHSWINKIYNLKSASVARYDLAAIVVRLMVMKPNYAPKYEFRFICVPNSYQIELSGSSDPNEDTLAMNLSIVGMIGQSNPGNLALYQSSSNSEFKPTWTDITLLPDGGGKQ